jgi:hypothetical protein
MMRWRALRLILVCALLALSARPATPPSERAEVMLVAPAERAPEKAAQSRQATRRAVVPPQPLDAPRDALRVTSVRLAPHKLYLRHCSLLS